MTSTLWRVAALVLVAISPNPQAPAGRALDRWADAIGGRETLQGMRTIHLRGTIATSGLTGTFERWATSRGQFRMALEVSTAIRQVSIFDGHQGWTVDASGVSHELTGGSLRSVISSAYETSDSFLFPGRLPGRVDAAGEDAGHPETALTLVPEGGDPITVYLDGRSFLPVREETAGPSGRRTITFSDWREVAGIKLPYVIRQSNGDSKLDAVITTEVAEINAPFAPELFTNPGNTASPIQFSADLQQTVSPVDVYLQHVYLPVRVNGSEPGWFFLDSGAERSFVSTAWAEHINLAAGGGIRAGGIGTGSTTMGLSGDVMLSLPGAEVPLKGLGVWDLSSFLPLIGRQWDGDLGYDVISRLIVRVDYERRELTLSDPTTFVPSDRAVDVPVTFLGNLPLVRAAIVLPGQAPIEADFVIDSGASGSLHLASPFASRHHVVDALRHTTTATTRGVGGETTEVAGRIARLQLGPFALAAPVVSFSTSLEEGLLANPAIGGIIGGEILERFTVTLDYPHRRILLEPNRRLHDPFRKNASGLSILARGAAFRRFEVDHVDSGSPASAAGIHLGDMLTSLDGHPASDLTLDRIEAVLRQDGRTVRMILERNGATIRIALKLRKQI